MTTKDIAMHNRNKKTKTVFPETRNLTLPALRFTPTAWAKLLFLRDRGDTEVGGFGITSRELLLVEDIQLVKQCCSWASVAFDDDSVADYFDQQVDAGRTPEQFARIWVHTHPGDCARPSMTDEATFDRVFGRASWAVMFVLACEGQSYARLRFNIGPGAALEIPVVIDYSRPFEACDFDAWEKEFLANVRAEAISRSSPSAAESAHTTALSDACWNDDWTAYISEDENLEDPIL